jgi:hypothetical protein
MLLSEDRLPGGNAAHDWQSIGHLHDGSEEADAAGLAAALDVPLSDQGIQMDGNATKRFQFEALPEFSNGGGSPARGNLALDQRQHLSLSVGEFFHGNSSLADACLPVNTKKLNVQPKLKFNFQELTPRIRR